MKISNYNNNKTRSIELLNNLSSKSNSNINQNNYLSNLTLNPSLYREIKTRINMVNNIKNEIYNLKLNNNEFKIDFLNEIKISEEEYNKSLNEINLILLNLNEYDILDLKMHKKLHYNEKKILEIFYYLTEINENFDFNSFKNKINLNNFKENVLNINYQNINPKRINFYLNQISHRNNFNNFFSTIALNDKGLEIIFQLVKNILKIFLYLFQNKKLKKDILITTKQTRNIKHKSISLNPIQKQNLYNKLNKYDSTNYSDNNFNNINEYKNKDSNNKNNIVNVNIINDFYNDNNLNTIKILSSINSNNSHNSINNDKITSYNIEKKNNNKIIYINNFSDFSSISHSSEYFNINKIFNLIQNKNKKIKNNNILKNTNSRNKYHNQNNENLNNIKIKNIILNRNYMNNFINKEKKINELLPLLKYKTFHEMREYFNMIPNKGKINKEIEEKNKNIMNKNLFNDRKSQRRIMNLLAKGENTVLKNVPIYKIKKIIQNNY
jgi:hypothetical protein